MHSTSPLQLEDFFPDCFLPSCPITGVHQHILPHQQQIIDCSTKYLYCQGGVGSAKSLAFAVRGVKMSLDISDNVGVVTRKDYKLMYKSCWLDIKQVIRRLVQKGKLQEGMQTEDQLKWYEKKMFKDKRQGDYTTIHFPNNSIIYAVQGKAWEEGLGASYGWSWSDDAMELDEEYFTGNNTSAGILSRLRLPHVHFHAATYHEQLRKHGSLCGMVSSNPPPYGHWLHKLFGNKPGIHKLGEDDITWLQVATTDNPFVGDDYSKGLIAVQERMGHDKGTVRRVILGESVAAYKGTPVFPQFDPKVHVAPLRFRSDLPLIRSWDFGFLHPSVIFANIYKCKYNTFHYFTIGEVVDGFNITVHKFWKDHVLPYTTQYFPNPSMLLDCGDNSGYRGSSANKDGRSDMKVLIYEYHIPFRRCYTNLTPSLQYMRSLLQPRKPCLCNLPLVLISNKCTALIAALEGGYHFTKSRGGIISDKPVEERYFADVACAWRYGAENFIRRGMPYDTDEKGVEHSAFTRNYQNTQQQRNQWLDSIDPPLVYANTP